MCFYGHQVEEVGWSQDKWLPGGNVAYSQTAWKDKVKLSPGLQVSNRVKMAKSMPASCVVKACWPFSLFLYLSWKRSTMLLLMVSWQHSCQMGLCYRGNLLLHPDFTKMWHNREREEMLAAHPSLYYKIHTNAHVAHQCFYSPLEVLNDFLLSYIFG